MYEGGAAGDGVRDVECDFLGGAFVDEGAVGPANEAVSEYGEKGGLNRERTHVSLSRPFPTLNAATFSARREANSA